MQEINKLNEILINNTKKALIKNSFDVLYLEKKEDVVIELKKIIKKDSIIGFGGSRTLEEISFFNEFNKNNYPNFLDRNDKSLSSQEKHELHIKALSADFYICSANGISQSGELVLIDKNGNRNAAITFGPKKRIVIAGVNKIEADLNSALLRAQNKASVLNNIRFDTKNPCTVSGECMDCDSKNRLCSITTIVHRCCPEKSILVILIGENLGF
jgi:hypothetical protein